jgi:uncharacterized protein YcbK (DUF882 family)
VFIHGLAGLCAVAMAAPTRLLADTRVKRTLSFAHTHAIDVRLADVKSSVLRDAALELKRGGVGFYRASDFVHVDTGRFRTW